MKCCNKDLSLNQAQTKDNKEYVYYHCPDCGKKGAGKNKEEAEKTFLASEPEKAAPPAVPISQLRAVPAKNEVMTWAVQNMAALTNSGAQFIEKKQTQRLIEKNIRYISNLSGDNWAKVWKSEEGRESIFHGLAESLYYAAELGSMGSLVPFNGTCEFIPAVECFTTGLTTGHNPPFVDIDIFCIHKNDKKESGKIKKNFYCDIISHGSPRGEIIQVVVMGTKTDSERTIGEIYDLGTLMKKAEEHSASYRSYLKEWGEFLLAETEGKVKTDGLGRRYFIKTLPGKGGQGTWEKKIYDYEITSPYAGGDRAQMLMKSAGKTFFKPFMKVRNATAVYQEWQEEPPENRDQAADQVLSRAASQFDDDIKDAEIIKTDAVKTESEKRPDAQEKNDQKKDDSLEI